MTPVGDIVQVALFSRGRHSTPRNGGCLMELVGATVGGPWTDRPACTSPVLAHLARAANDHSSPAARPALAPLIPYLISDSGRLDIHADLAAGATVLAAAHAAAPPDLLADLALQLQQAADDADLPRHRFPRLTSMRHRHRFLAVTDLALKAVYDTADPADRDAVLRTLLVEAINAQRRLQGLPPVSPPAQPLDPASLTVLTRLVMPFGADWHELEVRLHPEHVPTWLAEPWLHRQAELELHGW
jgi:hypothetical protein